MKSVWSDMCFSGSKEELIHIDRCGLGKLIAECRVWVVGNGEFGTTEENSNSTV